MGIYRRSDQSLEQAHYEIRGVLAKRKICAAPDRKPIQRYFLVQRKSKQRHRRGLRLCQCFAGELQQLYRRESNCLCAEMAEPGMVRTGQLENYSEIDSRLWTT